MMNAQRLYMEQSGPSSLQGNDRTGRRAPGAHTVPYLLPFSTSAWAVSVRPEPECLGLERASEVPQGDLAKGLIQDLCSEGERLGEQASRHSLQLPSRLAAGSAP